MKCAERRGSKTGYDRHRRAGEEPCEECMAGKRAHTAAYRARLSPEKREKINATRRLQRRQGSPTRPERFAIAKNWHEAGRSLKELEGLVDWSVKSVFTIGDCSCEHCAAKKRFVPERVERFLDGEYDLALSSLEKAEVARQWHESGQSLYSMQRLVGWYVSDYFQIGPDCECVACTDPAELIDEAVVIRVLGGEWNLPVARAEKMEVTRRWRSHGRYLNHLAQLTGWNTTWWARKLREEQAA